MLLSPTNDILISPPLRARRRPRCCFPCASVGDRRSDRPLPLKPPSNENGGRRRWRKEEGGEVTSRPLLSLPSSVISSPREFPSPMAERKPDGGGGKKRKEGGENLGEEKRE